jgi:hypothetical protein
LKKKNKQQQNKKKTPKTNKKTKTKQTPKNNNSKTLHFKQKLSNYIFTNIRFTFYCNRAIEI